MDAEKAHFVTQHRADLIQKVSTVMAIVESLGTFVHPEIYAEIHAERTSRGQMRILYLKLVDSGGPVVKAAFYEALKEHQPHLLEDHGPVPPSYADPVCPSQLSAPAADLHPESDVLLSGCLKVLQTTMEMYNVPNPGMPGCPPGLEYLTQVDQLLVKQKVEAIEALIGFESNNKYEVRNAVGQNVFYAVEENDCLSRQCCGPLRPFTIRVLDNFGQEVISVSRPLKCMGCCFPCCLQELEVQAPPGNTVGYVVQQWHPFSPKFIVEDEHREPILKIHGPFCGWSCLPDVDFEIMTLDEVTKIGKISKQWTGLLREVFTDADNFGIQFPMDLDVKMKATMIGACFLIDFMFFESNN